MALLLSILILVIFGLALFQGWQLWYMRREHARLEQRLSESLDDQDLLEFQERLKGLLAETREAGLDLVQNTEQRQRELEIVLARAVEAEKRLSVRAQLLELAAKEISKGAPTYKEAPAPVVKAKAAAKAPRKPAPKAKLPAPPLAPSAVEPPSGTSLEPEQATAKETAAQEEARRSYLSRSATPPVAAPNRYQRIYELSDQGLSREQIARESGILPGEVELILNLRPGKRRPS